MMNAINKRDEAYAMDLLKAFFAADVLKPCKVHMQLDEAPPLENEEHTFV